MSNVAEDIDTKEEVIWSTWEELLLAFAVKRHGLKDWDTVAMELQTRQHRRSSSSLLPGLFTAQICKDKYRNLKQRFMYHRHGGGGGGSSSENNDELKFQSDDDNENDEGLGGGGVSGGGDGEDAFPLLEELRKLRVAELRQEVHRYDVSIRSLQIKVKTLEEERENSLKEDRNDDVKQPRPDLDDEEVQRERSENDKSNGENEISPEHVGGKSDSGEEENMSFNESNSAGNRGTFLKTEPDNEPAGVKPDHQMKPLGGGREDSCNDSSDWLEVKKKLNEEREKEDGGGDSCELRNSVGESKEGTKESSDVQSSASLLTSKRKMKRRRVDGESDDSRRGGGDGSPVPIKRESEAGEGGAGKSIEPSAVISLLDKIRSHKHGSVFERRLKSQKTEKYKKTIRRHVDLEIIQARIDDGSYSSCSTKFYVDLLLLFNNAIVFFPKASPESLAAQELRELVMKELKKKGSSQSLPPKLQPKPEPERSDSLLAKNMSTNPTVVSRKRSSISVKASSSSANKKVEKEKEKEKGKEDDKPVTNSKPVVRSPLSTSNKEEDSVKLKIKEKPVTGARSMRSNKGRTHTNKTESTPNSSSNRSLGSQQHGVKNKGEAGKGDKKKPKTSTSTKKSSAVDFLERMKKNSPAKGTSVEALKSSKDNAKGGKKEQQKKKMDERKDGPVRRSGSGGGGSGRKTAKEEISPSKRTMGRPSTKGKEVVISSRKRGRDGGEEGSSQRAKKRSR